MIEAEAPRAGARLSLVGGAEAGAPETSERCERHRPLVEAAGLASVIDAFSVGVVLLSARGEIVAMNRAAMDLFDVQGAPVEGVAPGLLETLRVEWPDGRRVEFEETPFARARRGEVVRDVLLSLVPPDQGRRWIQVGAAPLGLPGPVHTIVVNLVDVTRTREAEQERVELLRHLVAEVAPAIGRIAERARTVRAAGAAGPPAGCAGEILSAARRVTSSLRELETALRFDAGAIVAEPELVDVKAFLLDLLERASPELDVSRVIPSVPPGLPRAHVDPDHLERILVELVRGALAGAPPGSDVAVAADAGEGRLHLTVASSGQDIAAEDLPRLFDRFFKARGRPVGRLHAVRSLVEANHGHVTAESGAGRGLAIRVSLPLRHR